jgi:molybdopterin-binding protein
MKISARNKLKGIVKKVNEGVVNSEVIVELAPGIEITSVITKSSVDELEIVPGKKVYAVIKASNVMLGVDH